MANRIVNRAQRQKGIDTAPPSPQTIAITWPLALPEAAIELLESQAQHRNTGTVERNSPLAEQLLRDLQAKNRAGKTLNQYAEALAAFCKWCVVRDYLNGNPLKGFRPLTKRRGQCTA